MSLVFRTPLLHYTTFSLQRVDLGPTSIRPKFNLNSGQFYDAVLRCVVRILTTLSDVQFSQNYMYMTQFRDVLGCYRQNMNCCCYRVSLLYDCVCPCLQE